VIVMDRENPMAPGYSHVLSTTGDMAELDAFRLLVGAPRQALHIGRRWAHLDLKLESRERALVAPGVRVFERTAEMLRYVKSLRVSTRSESRPEPSPRAPARD
jgi:hypothetical protein